eukprot:RCo038024
MANMSVLRLLVLFAMWVSLGVPTLTPTPTASPTPVRVKVPFKAPSVTVPLVQTAWCSNFFPTWFLVVIYFLTCFTGGYSVCGLVYTLRYLDCPERLTKQGEVVRNRLLGRQRPVLLGCCVFLLFSLAVMATALIAMMVPTFCGHVIVYLAFFGIVCVAAVVYAVMEGRFWIKAKLRASMEKLETRRKVAAEYQKLTETNALSRHHRGQPRSQIFW